MNHARGEGWREGLRNCVLRGLIPETAGDASMTTSWLMPTCFAIIGALMAYSRHNVICFLAGLLLAALTCRAAKFPVRTCIIAASITVVLTCFIPMEPGPIEVFLYPLVVGFTCSAITAKQRA